MYSRPAPQLVSPGVQSAAARPAKRAARATVKKRILVDGLSWRDCLKILGLRIVVDEDRGSYLASKGFFIPFEGSRWLTGYGPENVSTFRLCNGYQHCESRDTAL